MKDGRTNFSELQAALAAGRQEALTFNVFDLLFLEGFDLRDAPLIERKRILKELLDEVGVSGPVRRPSCVGRAALIRPDRGRAARKKRGAMLTTITEVATSAGLLVPDVMGHASDLRRRKPYRSFGRHGISPSRG